MSDFSPEGTLPFPGMYSDEMQTHEFSTWPQVPLEELHQEYFRFLGRADVMPTHRQRAERIMGHIIFELTWRGMQESDEVEYGTLQSR